MKKGIHPKYNNEVLITCACGSSFAVGSTTGPVSVEICSKCHPFWTGEQKFIDVEGRIDKFKKKQESGEMARQKRVKMLKEKIQKDKQRAEAPRTLKEMLKSMQ